MTAYTESQIIGHISTVLMDTSTAIWGTAQISHQIQQDLRTISRYRPQLAFSTVTFASTAKALVATALTAMIGDPVALEYETGKDPIKYRNFEFRDGTVIPDISFVPGSGDTAFIWYNKAQEISGTTTNTLDPEEERILIQLVAAHLQINKAGDLVNQVNVGSPTVDFRTLGESRERVAMQDLRTIADSHHHIPQDWPRVR